MRYTVDRAVAGRFMRAEVRSYYWPRTQETLLNFDEYQFGRVMPSRSETFHGRLKNSSRTCPFGELSLIVADLPFVIHQPQGHKRIFVCAFQSGFFEDVTGLRGGWNEQQFMHYLDVKSASVAALTQRMYSEVVEPGFASELFIESAGNLLLIELARYLPDIAGKRDDHKGKSGGLAPWQLRRIEARLAALHTGSPTIHELAGLCGISDDHVMRSFKASTGKTLHKYLEEKRLNAAKEMLAGDSLSIKEIAACLGFSSQTYFCAAFRKHAAMTPTAYRRLLKSH
jgi:AraC family transcriptional regulator